MTRVTRYFLVEFIKPLIFSLAALTLLILVSELLEHLDKFMAGKAGVARVAVYLLSVLPMRFVEVLPIATLLAVLFSLGNLSRRNEITAAMSGGLHPWKCVLPILYCGVALSLLALALNEWIVPFSSQRAQRLWKMEIRRFAFAKQTKFDHLTVAGKDGVFFSIGILDSDKNKMDDVALDFYEKGRIVQQIQASQALWKDGVWTFLNGVRRVFNEEGLDLLQQTFFKERKMVLRDKPEDLIPQEPNAAEVSYKDFKRLIRRLKSLGVPTRRQEVDLHMKMAFPWTSLIVMVLGIPYAFQKGGSRGKAIGFVVVVAFMYFGLMQVGRALGQKEWCPPLLGAWLANIIFLVIGMWLFLRMRRLA